MAGLPDTEPTTSPSGRCVPRRWLPDAFECNRSGKSYTMMGQEEDPGVIPMMIEGLFREKARMEQEPLTELQVRISYLEIYKERDPRRAPQRPPTAPTLTRSSTRGLGAAPGARAPPQGGSAQGLPGGAQGSAMTPC
ncbi:unnamed protein product [Polarella glacialis]|uniref:Kinesin motor domain-containing protein n=1 Tax=Polarella glacialis TaxID=89957 RepID=A0A813H503_POLGL|nr:unnamed protein product [Polarella glacialis]